MDMLGSMVDMLGSMVDMLGSMVDMLGSMVYLSLCLPFLKRTLTVNIEFRTTKVPLKIFLEIGETATFADVQQLVCEHVIWIVG